MEKKYREELKNHLKKSMQINHINSKMCNRQSPATDLVQSLFPTQSFVHSSRSRTVDALLDVSYSSRSGPRSIKLSESMYPRQYSQYMYSETSSPKLTKPNVRSPTPFDRFKRINGGEVTEKIEKPISSLQSSSSNANSSVSKGATFKKITSRDLINMVKSQCKEIESLNINDNESESIVLWRSKKKFNSSVDLHSDILLRSDPSESDLNKKHRKQSLTSSPNVMSARGFRLGELDTESIVRNQFTAPLIREVERVYVQNIETTADLLKKLECMPGDIDKALAKMYKL